MPLNQPDIFRRGRTTAAEHRDISARAAAPHRRHADAISSIGSLRRVALLCGLMGSIIVAGCGKKQDQPSPGAGGADTAAVAGKQRIVTLGGTITEITYALGAGDQIIGTDISSTYPETARKLPQVGYQRTIAAEQVLSLNPTLVLASEDAGPPAAIEQLRNAGVKISIVHGGHTVEGARQRITEIAGILGKEQAGRALIDTLNADLARMSRPDSAHKPRIMYVNARGGNGLQVSGTGTAADAIIGIAGGVNAVTSFTNYKPLTPEAAIGAAPDVILVSKDGFDQLGGADAIIAMPGIAETPAARSKRIVPIDDLYVLGFGPRLGKAGTEMATAFSAATTGTGR